MPVVGRADSMLGCFLHGCDLLGSLQSCVELSSALELQPPAHPR